MEYEAECICFADEKVTLRKHDSTEEDDFIITTKIVVLFVFCLDYDPYSDIVTLKLSKTIEYVKGIIRCCWTLQRQHPNKNIYLKMRQMVILQVKDSLEFAFIIREKDDDVEHHTILFQ